MQFIGLEEHTTILESLLGEEEFAIVVDPVFNRFNSLKTLVYADRIEAILRGEMPPPVVLHMYLTNYCPGCSLQSICIMKDERVRYPVKMSTELIVKALRDASENDVKLIHFTGGGEPTGHPDFKVVVELAHRLGLQVAVSTNGLCLSYCSWFFDSVDHYRCSFNAGTKVTYEKALDVPGMFNFVVGTLRDWVEAKRESGKVLPPDIGMAFLIVPENYKEIYRFCALAADVGVDFVHIRPAWLKDDKELRLILPEAFYYCKRAQEDFGDELDIFASTEKFEGHWTPRKFGKCLATPLEAVLTATGEFIVCQDVFEPRFGDYNKQEFWEIWDSDEHRAAINQIDLSKCPRCVETKINEIIERVFINDEMRRALL